MRMQILEVPGGKPILVISENPGAKDFELDMSDEDRFLERCGLGGVVVSERQVVLGPESDEDLFIASAVKARGAVADAANALKDAAIKSPVPGDKPVGGLDEWRRSLSLSAPGDLPVRPVDKFTLWAERLPSIPPKCDATCTNGAGCACDDDETPVGECMYGPCTSWRQHKHGIECVDACRCRKAKKARADA